jgi:catechol 2,3-dioxygenase-like lactoylglutathione lyase family enzyme
MNINAEKGLQSLALNNLAFTVSDIGASINWYSDVLGFKVTKREEFAAIGAQVAFLAFSDIRLEMLQVPDSIRIDALFAEAPAHLKPIGNKVLVLEVSDLAAATRELEEKDVTFAWKEKNLTKDGTPSTMIRDNDGNFINIFQKG